MFDIGFTELLVCLVVGLVVIGPEQLPGAVRSVSLWIGRLKRSLRETRTEIERQIGADDIRRQLHNEDIMQRIEETRQKLENSILYTDEKDENDLSQSAHWNEHVELPDHAHMEALADVSGSDASEQTHSATQTNSENYNSEPTHTDQSSIDEADATNEAKATNKNQDPTKIPTDKDR